jgi:hypothetical protein
MVSLLERLIVDDEIAEVIDTKDASDFHNHMGWQWKVPIK